MTIAHSQPVSGKTKKREINPEAKRDAILDVSEQLFADKGYAGTSTAEIAAKAGVAVGTIFRIFGDKPGILETLHERMERRFVDAMNRGWTAGELPYPERFRPMYAELLRCAERYRKVMPLYGKTKELSLSARYQPGASIIAAIQENYGEGVREGAFVDMDPEQVAFMTHGMVDGAMRYWMMQPTRARMNETVDRLVEFTNRLFLTGA